MRCPDCNKFVSYEDPPECEVQSCEVVEKSVEMTVRVILKCADCGNELKDAEIEGEAEIEHQCSEPEKFEKMDDDGHEMFTLEGDYDAATEPDSRTEQKDRNGRTIKLARYMKTYYGFKADLDVKCNCCEEAFKVEMNGEEQASGFNELV